MSVVRKSWVILFFITNLVIAAFGLQFVHFGGAETYAAVLPELSLTVANDSGSQVVFDENNITGLSTASGYGGFINQLNNVKGWGNYTGVPLNILCGLAGGLTNNSLVKVIASDGYSVNFTYDEVVNGNFTTYDRTTKAKVSHSQPVVPVIAYYVNDTSLGSSDGPLRLAIVGPEELVTNSTYWVKMVVRIEVLNVVVPEFPSTTVLPLLVITTLAALLVFKINRKRKDSVSQS